MPNASRSKEESATLTYATLYPPREKMQSQARKTATSFDRNQRLSPHTHTEDLRVQNRQQHDLPSRLGTTNGITIHGRRSLDEGLLQSIVDEVILAFALHHHHALLS